MSLTSDNELKKLFKNAGKEIPDHGFTRRVMHSLPQEQRSANRWIVWIFATIGILTAALTGAISVFINALATFGHDISHLQRPDVPIAVIYLTTVLFIVGYTSTLFKKDFNG